MRIGFLVVVALTTGCKDKWDKAIGEMEGFKDRMCACKDAKCADDVTAKMSEWQATQAIDFGNDDMPPQKMLAKADAIDKELRKCK